VSKVSVGFLPQWQRPIRIPENVAIARADPPHAIAGETSAWRLTFRLSANVAPDTPLLLELWSHRNNKGVFEVPEAGISAETGDGSLLALEPAEPAGAWAVAVPDGGFGAGDEIVVTLGPDAAAPLGRTLNKFFLLYCGGGSHRPTVPAGRHRIVGACSMHVLGGAIDHLHAYAPSQARPGERFDALVRGEDALHNLSCRKLRRLEVLLDGQSLPAAIDPVPESTCMRLRVSLPAPGVYRLTVRDEKTGLEAVTNPIVCGAENGPKAYWGCIHGHTEISDGQGTLDHYFRQMRDEAGLDFAATGDHDHPEETPDAMWDLTCAKVAEYDAPGEFVTLLGYEWARWNQTGDGDRNVYYFFNKRPLYRCEEDDCPTPPDLFAALAAADEEAIVIPHHTGCDGNWCDFRDHDGQVERLIEIYQLRGSYECSVEDGNPIPERACAEPMRECGYVRRALQLGWRVGFTAGGDDHVGQAGTDYPFPRTNHYQAGLMCVRAASLDRRTIFQAMYDRRVVATTGARILLDFTLSGASMGSELSAAETPELKPRRVITAAVHGTAAVEAIDVIRNGRVLHTATGDSPDARLEWVDEAPLAEVLMDPAKFCPRPFCYYYIRIRQADGEMAWASPVWIDSD